MIDTLIPKQFDESLNVTRKVGEIVVKIQLCFVLFVTGIFLLRSSQEAEKHVHKHGD